MGGVIDFIVSWKDLITSVFSQYPVAASLAILLAIGAFFALERNIRQGHPGTNVAIVFVGWAILVPLLGLVMAVLANVWKVFEGTVPIVTKVFGSFYGIYEKHPIVVLTIVVCFVGGYFIWPLIWPKMIPNRKLRVLSLVVGTVVVVHIASPIADLLTPAASNNASPTQGKATKSP